MYIVHAEKCVNSISHAHIPHIKVAHMPHKYILQVSDAELIVDVYATYSIIHERRHKKFILLVLCDTVFHTIRLDF